MLFDNLPFEIKGDVLSYLDNYKLRKWNGKIEFVLQISREKRIEMGILLSKISKIYYEKQKQNECKTYVEFSNIYPIWRIVHFQKSSSSVFYFYERIYWNHTYKIPIK